ncbi:family 43 glycosylhydrolase [Flavihumibacter fluvii]|uniref:family 43 glycosylhydrolase n=1 Tax=Flavihumibacter fluvii TaxID=2838157 RepID=UPI001BDF6996|nr:family 43 glycosylhydrolase [Flavihumibacter fluvii]ULQ54038.1 family 43 glycosylhydrolase [Flavihumibacter fluvii]
MSRNCYTYCFVAICLFIAGCKDKSKSNEPPVVTTDSLAFPAVLTQFKAYDKNPVFTGTGGDTWDQHIRERGYIIKEDSIYHMWYTGFRDKGDTVLHLGYATSPDGFTWTRYAGNPLLKTDWVEDMTVIKKDSTYYMFAEGWHDVAHLLTSTDKVHWTEKGNLDIRYTNGQPLTKGAYGTPAIWLEDGKWYLFYERGDMGIWLATSTDLETFTNVQDEPVIALGPETYDKAQVAMNQIVKYEGKYYGYYHALATDTSKNWTSNIASSTDLIHWKKFPGNPILQENKSSAILVFDGKQYRLYTMHDKVAVHFPN